MQTGKSCLTRVFSGCAPARFERASPESFVSEDPQCEEYLPPEGDSPGRRVTTTTICDGSYETPAPDQVVVAGVSGPMRLASMGWGLPSRNGAAIRGRGGVAVRGNGGTADDRTPTPTDNCPSQSRHTGRHFVGSFASAAILGIGMGTTDQTGWGVDDRVISGDVTPIFHPAEARVRR